MKVKQKHSQRQHTGTKMEATSRWFWCWAAVVFVFAFCVQRVNAFSVNGNMGEQHHRVVVVGKKQRVFFSVRMGDDLQILCTLNNRVLPTGKLIIDEYRGPDEEPSSGVISVGGGGPQAAFGAAAALAVLKGGTYQDPLPPQPVTFFGPVGHVDWTARENDALYDMLGSAVDSIHGIEGLSLRTPRIQLWHDKEQNIKWKPLYNSFGPEGADGLWRNRPSAEDILTVLDEDEAIDSLHVILEAGAQSPGEGADGMLLTNSALLERTKVLGIEPITFPDDSTGEVTLKDAQSCSSRLDKISTSLDFVSPDAHLYRVDPGYWKKWDVAVRDGSKGSLLLERISEKSLTVPAASLVTPNGQPINPTGAGNAYSAAITACLGMGASLFRAACIATAIGAVVCEHNHLPPWNAKVLKRIHDAADEVRHLAENQTEITL